VRLAFPEWRGFEVAPEGHLLDQLVDLSGPMGVAHERSVGFYKELHRHDRLMLIAPRGACVMRVKTAGSRVAYDVDHSSVLIVPHGVEHEDRSLTSIFETLVLFPAASLLEGVAADEGIAAAQARRLYSRCRKLPRGRWLEQLLQEYFFARVVSRRESAMTLAFFERQIVVELLAALGGTKRVATDQVDASGESVTGRALRYIESNLFSKTSVAVIARQAFASASTLLRSFQRDIGTSPYGYIKVRRLEEARRLIEAGTHPVGDVALLVGYENFGAFSTAFKAHFGRSPSSFRRGRERPGRRRA